MAPSRKWVPVTLDMIFRRYGRNMTIATCDGHWPLHSTYMNFGSYVVKREGSNYNILRWGRGWDTYPTPCKLGAEVRGVVNQIVDAHKNGVDSLFLRSDSTETLNMVHSIYEQVQRGAPEPLGNLTWKQVSRFQTQLDRITFPLSRFRVFKCGYIPGACNLVADAIAKSPKQVKMTFSSGRLPKKIQMTFDRHLLDYELDKRECLMSFEEFVNEVQLRPPEAQHRYREYVLDYVSALEDKN